MTGGTSTLCQTCEGSGWLHAAGPRVIVCQDCEGSGLSKIGVNRNMSARPTTIIHRDLAVEANKTDVRITRQSDMTTICLSMTEWAWLVNVAVLFDWPMAPPSNNAGQNSAG